MTKRLIFTLSVLGLVLAMLPTAHAAGTVCGTADTNLVTDGRVLDFDFLANGATGFYRFDTSANRSYSIEVRQDYDDDNTDFNVTILASDCSTAATTNDTSTTEPLPAANTVRRSFNTASGGLAPGVYYIKVVNGGAVGHYLSASVSDTSLFSPQWTTFSGFITSWSFLNTTNSTIHGKLVLTDYTTGTVIASPAVNSANAAGVADNGILPGKTAFLFTFSNGISIAANKAGNATFVHDGPPGAVVVGAFTQSQGGQGNLILPVKFEQVRAASH